VQIAFAKLDAEGAALALTTVGLGFEIMSALNSSPWTAENFGADEAKAKSSWSYTMQGCGINVALGVGASVLTETWWPLIGTSAVSVYMAWTYHKALARGMASGSTSWDNMGGSDSAPIVSLSAYESAGPESLALDLAA
jgi:hypothetical protein